MNKRYLIATVIIVGLSLVNEVNGYQNTSNLENKVTIQAIPLEEKKISVDGNLDEDIWENNLLEYRFIQRDPNEGSPSNSKIEIAIVYDKEAIYIAARMESHEPILAPISRRDVEANAERLVVSLDTYNNKITAYSFGVTASGVRLDYYHPNDSQSSKDYSFNPVWIAKTKKAANGWQAEMEIPFSQLRFNNKGDLDWGININRWIPSENEDSYLVMVPKNETGWASRFGSLEGISDINRKRKIELTPYIASNSKLAPANRNPQNPFYQRFELEPRLGGDIKMGIGSNLTLEATINPDFGQIEADPAQVNLGVFETFFQERRPFFTEGRELFRGTSGPNYFYSRRIGARPNGSAFGDFVERPDFTNILGATKLTGRTSKGLSIGFMTAITQKEYANIYNIDSETIQQIPIQPLVGAGVLRLQQEFSKSNSTVGIRFTGLNRRMEEGSQLYEQFSNQAYSANTDWNLRFRGGKYSLSGSMGFSSVHGSNKAIYDLQHSSARYFQRPDAYHVRIDSSRTHLNGYAGNIQFAKNSGQHWLWSLRGSIFSPEFEINDIGLMYGVDRVNYYGSLTYRQNNPENNFLRGYSVRIGSGQSYNFAGTNTGNFSDLFGSVRFQNFWNLNTNIFINTPTLSPTLTRGGPLMKSPFFVGGFFNLSSNQARNTTFRIRVAGNTTDFGQKVYNISPGISLQPNPKWKLSIDPRFIKAAINPQYVTALNGGPESTFGRRYIFAELDRRTVSMQIRLNYLFTPDLSLEFYGEPFVASGRYHNFGELKASRTNDIFKYGTGDSSIQQSENEYLVNKDGQEFSIPNLDFKRLSYRSNLVLRWQWNPGSTFFLVWGQNRSKFDDSNTLVGSSDLLETLQLKGSNFFAAKITYWIPVRHF